MPVNFRFDGTHLKQPQIEEDDSWEITKGVKAGYHQTLGLFGGLKALAGSVLDDDEWLYDGLEYYQEKMDEASLHSGDIERIEDAESISDYLSYAAYTLGTVAPTIVGTGGVGALAGFATKKVISKSVAEASKTIAKNASSKEAGEALAKKYAQVTLGKRGGVATIAGAATTTMGLESGAAFARIYEEEGTENPIPAISAGILSGAFEAAGALGVLKRILPDGQFLFAKQQIAEETLKKRGVFNRVLREGAKGAGIEGVTEGIQEIIQQGAVSFVKQQNNPELEDQFIRSMTDEAALSGYLNSFVAGALGGGTIRGVTGIFGEQTDPPELTKEEQQQVDDLKRPKLQPTELPAGLPTPQSIDIRETTARREERQADADAQINEPFPQPDTGRQQRKQDAVRQINEGLSTGARARVLVQDLLEEADDLAQSEADTRASAQQDVRDRMDNLPDQREPGQTPEQIRARIRKQEDLDRQRGRRAERRDRDLPDRDVIYGFDLIEKPPKRPKVTIPQADRRQPIVDAMNQPIDQSGTPLDRAVGQIVTYEGIEGVLVRGEDGFYIETADGREFIERGESGTLETLGIEPTGRFPDPNLGITRTVDYNPDDNTFVVNRGRGRSKRYKYLGTNTRDDGVFEVVAETEDGERRNFVSPRIVRQLLNQVRDAEAEQPVAVPEQEQPINNPVVAPPREPVQGPLTRRQRIEVRTKGVASYNQAKQQEYDENESNTLYVDKALYTDAYEDGFNDKYGDADLPDNELYRIAYNAGKQQAIIDRKEAGKAETIEPESTQQLPDAPVIDNQIDSADEAQPLSKPQIELLASNNTESTSSQAKDNFNIHYEQVAVSTIPVGLDKVKTPEEAAHVFAPIRKHGQETLLALVTDKDGNILNLIRHTKGFKAKTSVSTIELVGAVAATDNAANVWFSHNHPSGVVTPSNADFKAEKSLRKALTGTGIIAKGHIIVGAGTSATHFKTAKSQKPIKIKPSIRNRTQALTERVIRRRQLDETVKIKNSDAAVEAAKNIAADNGLLLLDTNLRLLGSLSLTQDEMLKLKSDGQVNRILKAINDTNANSLIIKTSSNTGKRPTKAVENLARFLNNFDEIQVLDFIHNGKSSPFDWALSETGPFLSAATDNIPTETTKAESQKDATVLNNRFAMQFQDKSWRDAFEQVEAPQEFAEVANAIEKAFGRRTVFVRPNDKKFDTFRGVYVPQNKKTLYVNANSQVNFASVVGHEMLHDLKNTRKDLYNFLLGNAKTHFQNIDAYKAKLKDADNLDIEQEILADFTGDAFTDPAFMEQLAKDNPSKFKQLLNAITQWIQKLVNKLKGFESDQYFDDVTRMRDYLREVLDAFASDRPIGATGRQTQNYDETQSAWDAAKAKGLDMSQEGRMERAREQGFDTDMLLYHASKQDITELKAGYDDGLIFTTPDPEFANKWLGKGKFKERQDGTGSIEGIKAEKKRFREEQNEIMKSMPEDQRQKYYDEVVWPQTKQLITDENLADNAIYPLVTKAKKPFMPEQDVDVLEELYGKEYLDAPFGSGFPTYRDAMKDGSYLLYENKEMVNFLKSKGYDSMFLKESAGRDEPYTTLAVFDSFMLRSPHAAFDPDNADSSNLLFSDKIYDETQSAKDAAKAKGLGMSMADRMDRAETYNYTTDAFHGSTHNVIAMDAGITSPDSDWGRGIYNSNSIDDVNVNYAGFGDDLTNRIERDAENLVDRVLDQFANIGREKVLNRLSRSAPTENFDRLNDMDDMSAAFEVAKILSTRRLTENQGVVYPLKLNTQNFVTISKKGSTIIEGRDYYNEAVDEVDRADFDSIEDYEDAVYDRMYEMEADDFDSNRAKVADTLRNLGVEENLITTVLEQFEGDEISAFDLDNTIRRNGLYAEDSEGNPLSSGGISSEVFKALGFKGVIDQTVNDKFGTGSGRTNPMAGVDEDTVHYIVFEGAENQIRSVNAAFDPDNMDSPDLLFSQNETKEAGKIKKITDKVAKTLKRNLSPGGLLPKVAFDAKIERDGEIQEREIDIRQLLGLFDKAVKKTDDIEMLNEALGTRFVEIDTMPISEDMKSVLKQMRRYIDSMSKEYATVLFEEAQNFAAQNKTSAAMAKVDLLNTIASNIGRYLNRSYRAFDDPKWPEKVSAEVKAAAIKYLEDNGAENAEFKVNNILKEGTAFDSMQGFIKESKLGAKDLSILKRKKDIAPEIRALLGEYKDPKINFAKTATKMSRLLSNDRFLKKVLENGRGVFLFDENDAPPDNYKRIASDQSSVMSPLNGLYTTPETEQAFKDILDTEQMPDWVRRIVQLNGMVKYGKTVLSPTTQARNWMSASFFAIANGHNPLRMRKSIENIKTHMSGQGDTEYLKKLSRLGVTYDTPNSGEMMDLLRDTNLGDDIINQTGKSKNLGKRIFGALTKLYQYGDDFWKIVGFENEVDILMKQKKISREQAEPLAAKRIRDTYPTYSLVGRGVKKLRRFPLAGTFVSFPAEIIRTGFNIFRHLGSEMKDPEMRGVVPRRVAGLGMVSSAAYALQEALLSSNDISEEEEESLRLLLPEWSRNSNIAITGRDENGALQYVDLSHMDPYAYFKKPFTALMRDQPLDDAIVQAGLEVLTPFFGADITASVVNEVWKNKKKSGGKVYNEEDSPENQTADIGWHLFKGLGPGVVNNVVRTAKAVQGEVSPSGKKYKFDEEMKAWVGFRMGTFDPKVSLYYKTFEFNEAKRNSSAILKKVFTDPNKVSDNELEGAFNRAETARRQAFEKMIKIVTAARQSGLNRTKLMSVLRSAGISRKDAKAIIKGEMSKWEMTDSSLKRSLKKADLLFEDGKKISGNYQSRWRKIERMLD